MRKLKSELKVIAALHALRDGGAISADLRAISLTEIRFVKMLTLETLRTCTLTLSPAADGGSGWRKKPMEKVPGAHGLHASSLSLPGTGLALPASHAMHEAFVTAPGSALYVPAGHWSHTPSPSTKANAPGRHGMHTSGSSLPGTGLALPVGHARQSSELLEPRSGLYVPG